MAVRADWRVSILTRFVVLTFGLAVAAGCLSNGARPRDRAGAMLLLPQGAETDVGARCYASGACDLPFMSEDSEPEAVADQITSHYRQVGWEQRCPAPGGQGVAEYPVWLTSEGGGVLWEESAAVPETSRFWRCAWHDPEGNIIDYLLKTVRMEDGREPLTGYARFAPGRP